MKKTLGILLAVIFTFAAFFPGYCAVYANDSVDAAAAIELIKNARDIMRSFAVRFQWFVPSANPDGTDDHSNDVWVDGFNGWNMTSYFRPVREGFDAEGVKKLISDTFVKSVADNYTGREEFFQKYYTRDEKLYYYIPYGAQLGDFANLELRDEDIEGLFIVEPCTAAVRTKFILPYYDWFDGEVTVYFSFEKDAGSWKISGMDASGCVFKSRDEEYDLSSFSEDVARTEIRVLLGEIYRPAHVDGGEFVYYYVNIDDAGDSAITHINRFGKNYYRLNGTAGETETWLAYASRFASEEIAKKLVQSGVYCISEGGRMYYRERNSEDSYAFAAYDFRPGVFDNMELEIVSQTDSTALVRVNILQADKQEAELTFEFTRSEGQWKVSGGNFIEALDAIYAPEAANAYTGANDSCVFAAVVAVCALFGIVLSKKRSGVTGRQAE